MSRMRHCHLMGRPVVTRLRRSEASVVAAISASSRADLVLRLSGPAARCDAAPTDTGAMCCLQAEPGQGCWQGTVRARLDEPLPFQDEAFAAVQLDHALEWLPHANAVLAEAGRVLSDGGQLMVTGFHPFSLWAPWLLARPTPRPMLIAPGWLRPRLAAQGIDVSRVYRCGTLLPAPQASVEHDLAGGGYVLVAYKRRQTHVRSRAITSPTGRYAPTDGVWVPESCKECA